MESQCVGLAEAMGLTPIIKRVRLRRLWRVTSPHLPLGLEYAISRKGDALTPPWPDVVIASGRLSVLPSMYVKRMTKGRSFHVQIQNPACDLRWFDCVVVPAHDGLTGPNVISVQGALHRITPALLKAEAEKWAPRFAHLPRPMIAVLLGGNNASYRLDPRFIMEFGPQLAALAKKENASLLITPSRRTSHAVTSLLSALLHDVPHFFWDGQGDNPYFAMLGHADAIMVTCNSINMISESCSTGKPVMVVKLPGHSDKFASFHQSLLKDGRIHFFDGNLAKHAPAALNEMDRLASRVLELFQRKIVQYQDVGLMRQNGA